GFTPDRRHFVGIEANHQVVDVVIDLCEPVAGTGRDHHNVPWFELICFAVSNLGPVVSGPIELNDRTLGRGTALSVRDIGTKHQCGRPGDYMVDLADFIVFGNRVRGRRVQLPAVDNADADVRFADVDVPNLLVDQLLRDRFLGVSLELGDLDISARAHVAR